MSKRRGFVFAKLHAAWILECAIQWYAVDGVGKFTWTGCGGKPMPENINRRQAGVSQASSVFNSDETVGNTLHESLGALLKKSREDKGVSLEDAAKALGMERKGSASNIEAGRYPIPRASLVKFARFTGADPAVILILQAAARVFKSLESEEDRQELYSSLQQLLKLKSDQPLRQLINRSERGISGLAASAVLRDRMLTSRPFVFWAELSNHLPKITLSFAPFRGRYRELPTVEVLKGQYRVLLRGSRLSGSELAVIDFIQSNRSISPLLVDAHDLLTQAAPLKRYLSETLESEEISTGERDLLENAICIVHNLPLDAEKLQSIDRLIQEFLLKNGQVRVLVLAESATSVSQLDRVFRQTFECYDVAPITEREGIEVLRAALGQVSPADEMKLLDERIYLLVRNPFWLAVLLRLVSELGDVPPVPRVVRAGAGMLLGVRSALDDDFSLCELIRSRSQDSVLQKLSEFAFEELLHQNGNSARCSFNVEEIDNGSHYPLLERTPSGMWRFTSREIQAYLAAVHVIVQTRKKTQDALLARLDTWSTPFTALSSAAELINEMLIDGRENKGSQSLEKHLAQVKRRIDLQQSQLSDSEDPQKALDVASVEAESNGPIELLVEGESAGDELKRLAAKLRTDPQKVDLAVTTTRYDLLAKRAISLAESDTASSPDILISPHHALFRTVAVKKSALKSLTLSLSTEKRLDTFLARRCCQTFDGNWKALPFQFPTKVFCYRRDLWDGCLPPFSFDDFTQQLSRLKRQGNTKGLGLQARPRHASLYYEWASFVLALGGADVIWDHFRRGGEVYLDSDATLNATLRFLSLLSEDYSHPQSRELDWGNIVGAMAEGEIAICLPFNDAIRGLLERLRQKGARPKLDDLAFAPIRFPGEDVSDYVRRKLFGFSTAPPHVFTSHVMINLASNETKHAKAFRAMQWFVSTETQDEFANDVYQAPCIEFVSNKQQERSAYEALESSRYAQRYMMHPTDAVGFKDGLSQVQGMVLDTVSGFVEHGVKDREHVAGELVRTANAIRAHLAQSEEGQ